MRIYECKKGFNLEMCDDDGFTIENEYMDIDKGTIWTISEDENYRLIGGEIRLENEDGEWIEICEDTLKEHFNDVTDENRVIKVNITDELGTHELHYKDFVIQCNSCKKERHLYKNDIDENGINPKACECGGFNRFKYWLDGVYTEKEYKELEIKAKNEDK